MDLSSIAATLLIATFSALGTWTWHKITGVKADNFSDLVRGLGKQIVDQLVTAAASDPDALRLKARELMLAGFKRLGIPDNAITEAVVLSTLEHTVGDVLAERRAIDNANDALGELAARTQRAVDGIAAAEALGKAQTADPEYAAMIERVPPDSPATSTPTKDAQP